MVYGDDPIKWNEPVELGNPLLINDSFNTSNLNRDGYTKIFPALTSIYQSNNRYIYANHNPILQVDPSGKFIISTAVLFIVGGAIALGAVGGVAGNAIAEQEGATGWDKAAYIAAGAVIGAAVGVGVGYAASLTFTTITGITGISAASEGIVAIRSGLFASSQITQMISNIELNRINHIMQEKHDWNLVSANSWDDVSKIIGIVLKKGEGVMNNVGNVVYSYIHNSQTIEVETRIVDDTVRVVDAWVKTR